jgi:predicted RNA-binding Zn ribbon-like protein
MTKRDQDFTPQSPWLDLVNSDFQDGFGRKTDFLQDDRWVARFLGRWGLLEDLPERNPAPEELSELRGTLRRMAEELASGRFLAEGDVRSLNAILAVPSYRQLRREREGYSSEVSPVTHDRAWIRARIAGSFVDDWLEHPTRIKVCSNVKCRWAFVDATKGNVRRWCKDSRCSNRDRVRRARQRARARS